MCEREGERGKERGIRTRRESVERARDREFETNARTRERKRE